MLITVAVCTWNRSTILSGTLAALVSMRPPQHAQFEVLVVNNNSTDATSEVVRSFAGRLPIREVCEPVPGIASARNRVIDSAKGGYVCWIDDDVRVDLDWVQAYEQAFRDSPQHGFFGGRIEAEFEGGKPPAWLIDSLPVIGGVFGVTPSLNGHITSQSPHVPFSGNMATRLDVSRKFRFDLRLGRTAGNLLAGEETMFIRTMLAGNVTGLWVPDASARHFVTLRMQSLSHVRRYFHDWGVSLARVEKTGEQRSFMGRPLWMWRQAVYNEAMYQLKRLTTSPEQWVLNLKLASMAWGGLRQRPARVPRR